MVRAFYINGGDKDDEVNEWYHYMASLTVRMWIVLIMVIRILV